MRTVEKLLGVGAFPTALPSPSTSVLIETSSAGLQAALVHGITGSAYFDLSHSLALHPSHLSRTQFLLVLMSSDRRFLKLLKIDSF